MNATGAPVTLPPALTGTRVTLRRPNAGDVAARWRLGYDPEIIRMYGGDPTGLSPMSESAAAQWVESVEKHPHAWIIATDRLIGSIRLDRIDPHDKRASLAIGIEDRNALGNGLGSEAIRLVLQYAFSVLRLHRISVRVVAYNERAIGAYRKCGFVIEGREREAALVGGARHDDVLMGLLAREFLSSSPAC